MTSSIPSLVRIWKICHSRPGCNFVWTFMRVVFSTKTLLSVSYTSQWKVQSQIWIKIVPNIVGNVYSSIGSAPPRGEDNRIGKSLGGRTTELESVHEVTKELCNMGGHFRNQEGEDQVFWTERVKEYATTWIDIGEERLRKADLVQVAADMRKARETVEGRRFKRREWLTKVQV